MSVFALQDGAVYQTYGTTWRGVEFLMGYYPILDRMPKGRDEGDGWQLWLRRHDEYGNAVHCANPRRAEAPTSPGSGGSNS